MGFVLIVPRRAVWLQLRAGPQGVLGSRNCGVEILHGGFLMALLRDFSLWLARSGGEDGRWMKWRIHGMTARREWPSRTT